MKREIVHPEEVLEAMCVRRLLEAASINFKGLRLFRILRYGSLIRDVQVNSLSWVGPMSLRRAVDHPAAAQEDAGDGKGCWCES